MVSAPNEESEKMLRSPLHTPRGFHQTHLPQRFVIEVENVDWSFINMWRLEMCLITWSTDIFWRLIKMNGLPQCSCSLGVSKGCLQSSQTLHFGADYHKCGFFMLFQRHWITKPCNSLRDWQKHTSMFSLVFIFCRHSADNPWRKKKKKGSLNQT